MASRNSYGRSQKKEKMAASERKSFCNLPSIDHSIQRKVWNYIEKTMLSEMRKHRKFNEIFKIEKDKKYVQIF
jgi:hypothetical protein